MNYPLRVILDILGLPEEDFPKMLRLTQELFGDDDPDFQRAGEDDQAMAVIMDVITMFTGLNAERRENPTDRPRHRHRQRPDRRQAARGHGHLRLLPDRRHGRPRHHLERGRPAACRPCSRTRPSWDKLAADPSLIDGAADEIVRWVSPVKHFMRTAQQDYTLAPAATINKGDWVLLSYQSANRDERVFTDPFTFDVTRADADKHLGFGFGRHYCLGAHLARLEIRAHLQGARPPPRHHRAGRPHRAQTASVLVSGPKRMPVTYSCV